MSVFQSLVKKEALHLLRDFRTIIVVLVMPVVLLLLFGFGGTTYGPDQADNRPFPSQSLFYV